MKRLALVFFFAAVLLSRAGFPAAQSIYVNQVGYLPDRQKLVYFSSPTDDFSVVDAKSSTIAFKGKARLLCTKDQSTGLTLYVGDFSSLTREGTYRIAAAEVQTSPVFAVSPAVFSNLYAKSLKGYYFQRCGTALSKASAGVYARSACHLKDALFHPSTGQTGSAVTTGGWHDAGDYGKYAANAGISVGTLLLAYEQFPARFRADNLKIPESGNSVPDILDEVRYELEWLLTMQDPLDGGVYFKVTTEQFDVFEMPADDLAPQYIYRKTTTAAGDFAAIMAMAGRVYQPFDPAFASRCLAAAERAWRYLEANRGIVPAGGFVNPPGTDTGGYGDGDDTDERLWAATELYITTGADAYHAYFTQHYAERGVIGYVMGWQDVRALAQLEYLLNRRQKPDETVKSAIRDALFKRCGNLAGVSAKNGFNAVLNPSEYYWGSNSVALNDAILLVFGYELSGNEELYNAALQQLNYVLGCNVHGMTFVTGVGSKSPLHIHHRPSGADGIAEPVPGLLAGGPNRNREDNALKAFFTTATPPAACYVDNQASYASNEICINWNAPLVFAAGYFNDAVKQSRP